jgi:AraC family transcriptional regulator
MSDNATLSGTPISDPTLRLSSRGLGWGPLKMERRDTPPARYAFPEGVRRHQVFVSLASGRVRCERAGAVDRIEAHPGTVVVQPAGAPVTWHSETRLSFAVLLLDPDFLRQVARSSLGEIQQRVELQAVKRDSDLVISNIANVLSQELIGAQPGSRMYVESLARVFAVHLLRHYRSGTVPDQTPSPKAAERPVPPPVSRAVRYLEAHFTEDVTLDELARAAYCSPYYLSRRFKQAIGMTPFQYLVQLRVDHARQLVSAGAGERSLADVARAVGFADQSHLTRQMKRVLGVTPGMLRVA